MNQFRVFTMCNVLILCFWTAVFRFQDQVPQQDPDSLSARELVVLYARTKMDLAEIELNLLEERPRGLISNSKVERARSELAIAKTRYEQAMLASSGSAEKVRLAHAEEKVRLARMDRDKANELIEGRASAKFSKERAELRFKLAQIKLALLRNPENHVTLIEAMQAQIDQLSEEILALDLRLAELEIKSQ